jgi:hypothetical protein
MYPSDNEPVKVAPFTGEQKAPQATFCDEEGREQTADRLRRLPAEAQPPYDWLEFRRREQIRGGARNSRAGDGRLDLSVLPYAAVAATLLALVVGAVAVMSHGPATPALTQVAQTMESPRLPGSQPDTDLRAQDAERLLASLPPEPVIVRFGTRVAVASLEDRIAQVDDLMTAASFEDARPAHLEALRQERGRLVNSLAQVRYAEALAANAP